MKKSLFILAIITCFASNLKAQDNMMFNHMSIGPSLGILDGFGFEVAMPIGNYVNVRTGASFMPFGKTVDGVKVYEKIANNYVGDTDIDLNLKNNAFKLLFDIHPSKSSSFRFTVGAYIGNSKFVEAENEEQNLTYAGCYIKLGDKRFGFNEDGWANAHIKIASFRPYLGVGFGRAVGVKRKSAFNFDLGVQFWGTPKVYGYDVMEGNFQQLKDEDIDDVEGKKIFKTLTKISVCPVISCRYMFNIF